MGYEIETSLGAANESFIRVAYIGIHEARIYKIDNLLPLTTLRVRVRAVSRTAFGLFSHPLTVTTEALPVNTWSRVWPLRMKGASYGFGVAAPVIGRPHVSPNTEDPLVRTSLVHLQPPLCRNYCCIVASCLTSLLKIYSCAQTICF
jgi:hypothetical protein